MKRTGTVFILLGFLFQSGPASAATDAETRQHIERLERRIEKLESRNTGPTRNMPEPAPSPGGSSTATGISRAFNPAISVNGLFLGTFNSEGNADSTKEVKTGMKIQELEMRFTGNVDTYLRGDLTLSMEDPASIEIEQLIADLLVTNNLSFHAGKFFAPFGRHNQLHTHQFAFIDSPVVNEEIFGKEGLNEIGAGFNFLFPLPFFSELNLQFLEGDNSAVFNGPLNDDFAYLAHSSNLVDLSDELTMEAGGSFAYGKNSLRSGSYNQSRVAGVDLRFKYKPAGRELYRTLIWQSEFITASRDEVKTGAYTYLQYQFARRWWVQGRYGYFFAEGSRAEKNRYSALLAFVPSEFSAVRLQYNYLNQVAADEHQVFLQLNFTFGSHPAHQY